MRNILEIRFKGLIEEGENLIEGYDDKGEKNWRGKTRN